MTAESEEQPKRSEDYRRWRLAQQIVEENSGLGRRLMNDARERPATSIGLAFGLGLVLGLVIGRK